MTNKADKEKLQQIRTEIARDDSETLQDFCHYSADDSGEVVSFLEDRFEEGWPPSIENNGSNHKRALIVALSLLARVKAIKTEFADVEDLSKITYCDNGYTDLVLNGDLEDRARCLVARICKALKGDDGNNDDHVKLQEAIVSIPLLRAVVASSLGCDPGALSKLTAARLSDQILEL